MKKIYLIITLLTISISNAQMKVTKIENDKIEEVGKISVLGSTTAVLEKYENTYILTYGNVKYKQLSDFKSFKFGIEDIDNLYNIITSKDAKVNDTYNIDLPDDEKLTIIFSKQLGIIFPYIYHTDKLGIEGQLPYLTKKQWAKLFGKK